jgi:hypothetical protein
LEKSKSENFAVGAEPESKLGFPVRLLNEKSAYCKLGVSKMSIAI